MVMRRFFASTIRVDGTSGLLTDLVSYWKYDGDGIDEVASKSPILTDNIDFAGTGILGSAARNVNTTSPQILRYADSDDFSFTSGGGTDLPFSVSLWVNVDSISSTGSWIINKRNATSGGDEWQIYLTGSPAGIVKYMLFDQSTNSAFISRGTTNVLDPTFNAWHHIVCTYDGSKLNSGLKIYVDGIEVASSGDSGGTYTGMNNGSATLGLFNSNWNTGAGTLRFFGRIDELGIWKNRELTASEVSELYNSGAGLTYPF